MGVPGTTVVCMIGVKNEKSEKCNLLRETTTASSDDGVAGHYSQVAATVKVF